MAPRNPQISGRSAPAEHSLLRPPHVLQTLLLASALLGAAMILRGAVERGVASAIVRQLPVGGQLRQQQPWPNQQTLEGAPSGVLPSKLTPQGSHPQAATPPKTPSALQERHKKFQPLFLADLWGKPAPAKQLLQGYATFLPCEAYTCCDVLSYFRTGSRDFDIFQQVFEQFQMRYLFPVSDRFRPKYILDAGGNAGFSTMLFKLLWPEAVIVTLEPDASNFGMLQRNNDRFTGLHLWNAGLWGHQAKIDLLTDEAGSWGLIFKEVPPTTSGAIEAYSVKDIMRLLNITSFDMIKIDVEGAEGKVFAPGEDVSWLDSTQLVIMETHDRMANRFGLEEVSSLVADAFVKSSAKFRAIDDSEHVFLFSKGLADQLLADGA